MAERGAYLTGTSSYGKPTIFEIVAQESLSSTLEPAFKKIFTFLVTCNTERYGWLLQWSDEVYTVFHGVLQNFYIKNYGSSFSEAFYGLKRISLKNSNDSGKLSGRQEILSLIFLILHPYLQSKANQFQLEENNGEATSGNLKTRMKVYFFKIYKIYNILRIFLEMYHLLLYISNRSPYPNPFLRLLSLTLTFSGKTEVVSISEILRKIKEGNVSTNDGVVLLQRGFTRSLELGAFFLQFINWWNQENLNINLLSLPVPPPPSVPDQSRKYKGLCPICLKAPNIATALSISGYVFCYRCILSTIKKDEKCPVTHYPAREDDLIRLYID